MKTYDVTFNQLTLPASSAPIYLIVLVLLFATSCARDPEVIPDARASEIKLRTTDDEQLIGAVVDFYGTFDISAILSYSEGQIDSALATPSTAIAFVETTSSMTASECVYLVSNIQSLILDITNASGEAHTAEVLLNATEEILIGISGTASLATPCYDAWKDRQLDVTDAYLSQMLRSRTAGESVNYTVQFLYATAVNYAMWANCMNSTYP